MRYHTLDAWLEWQAGLHPRAIDPGLERVSAVADRLGLRPATVPVITVAGTNGKGSSVALLVAILEAGGYRTGAYTSPHLLRYNERIRIGGAEADDEAIMAAFDAIDRARGEISLSYFEFGTLAALWLFREQNVDVCLLEVGLGGRLDAVNMMDPDVALLTSIGLDHAEWLGHDRNAIGREKAGIMRRDRPAVFAGPAMPEVIREMATTQRTPLIVAGEDYHWRVHGSGAWDWQGCHGSQEGLPAPALPGDMQYRNAAGVLTALECMQEHLPVSREALAAGLQRVQLSGRLQVLPGPVEWLLDVAHNAEAVSILASELRRRPVTGRCHAVLGIMARKDLDPLLEVLRGHIDVWWPLALPDADARSAPQVIRELELRGEAVAGSGDAPALVQRLRQETRPGDRVVVFGSFRTVEEVLHAVQELGE